MLSVSFVMPMYNERENIERTLATLRSVASRITGDYEIVVVDDASTDGCGDIVKKTAAEKGDVKYFRLERNTKFGGAFAECFKRASKDVIMYMDSDMPVTVDDIARSFPIIKEADLVSGYSTVKKGDSAKRKFISSVYNFLVRTLFGLRFKDINSGYKIVKRSLVKDLVFLSRSPFIDVELFLHAGKKKAKVVQFPLVFRSRSGGKSYIARVPVIMATFRDMIKVWFLRVVAK